MTSQLRIYTMKPGAMEPFVALWREHVVPARAVYGFGVTGSWTTPDGAEFVWVVEFDGDLAAFEAADKAYYDSPERAALPTSPAEYIASMDLRMLAPVA
ncbi:hypothetical protein DSM112329_01376 [Paraconexibacter sp. AEG42_29]|uniref:NIPSNAP domain-containing protein n=1 Tax=Paraconexibacter sp. AEG42_29 TaxID=2997339 RepID=A0AAU7ASR0_9ACTN